MVTELVTNAALHGEPPITVRISPSPHRLRIEVEDAGRSLPVLTRQNTEAMTGRGMQLVATLTTAWGVQPRRGGGKVVWAELSESAGKQPAVAPDLDALLALWVDDDSVEQRYTVRLGAVPTDLLLAAKAHIDDVVREFILMRAEEAAGGRRLPLALAGLVDSVTHDFAEARAEIKRQAIGAAARGEPLTDLVLHLPLSAVEAGERYLAALDRVDVYARAARILTIAPPHAHQAFRRWYVQALVDQLPAVARGEPPPTAEPFTQVLAAEVNRLANLDEASTRLRLLQELNHQMAAPLLAQEIAAKAVDVAARVPGIEAARVYLLSDGRTLRSAAWYSGAGQLDAYDEISLDDDLPGAVAVRTRTAISYPNLARIYDEIPQLYGQYQGERSLHIVPLLANGRPLGALGVAFGATSDTPADQLAFVEALADSVAGALHRATSRTGSDVSQLGDNRAAKAHPGGRHWRPGGQAIAVAVVGLLVTAGLTAAWRLTYLHNERHLTALQTQLTGAALAVAPVDVERRLNAALNLTAGGANTGRFGADMTGSLAPKGPFAGAQLFAVDGERPRLLISVGKPTLLQPSSPQLTKLLQSSTQHPGASLTWITTPKDQRFGYAVAATGPAGTFVAYAEQVLPANRRVSVPSTSPVGDLQFALYFGKTQDPSTLVETNAARLPLRGTVSSTSVVFADQTLTLVAAPRVPIEGNAAADLPWGIAAIGVLLTFIAAGFAERLTRRHLSAQALTVELRALYRAQRGVTETLQRSLLPQRLPATPGIDVAVRYLAGTAGIEVGGDWYDVISIDEHRYLFAVGDVSGRGLDAAVLMSAMRNAVRAYVGDGAMPDQVLAKVSRLASATHDERFATMICWTLDTRTGDLVVANAGHPEPLLIVGDERRFLTTEAGPPLGVGESYPLAHHSMPLGATLLAYTDGLIERRGESLDVGLSRLREAVVPGSALEDLLDHLISKMVPDGAHDDIAILSVRRTAG